jgi:hypothetical protein
MEATGGSPGGSEQPSSLSHEGYEQHIRSLERQLQTVNFSCCWLRGAWPLGHSLSGAPAHQGGTCGSTSGGSTLAWQLHQPHIRSSWIFITLLPAIEGDVQGGGIVDCVRMQGLFQRA